MVKAKRISARKKAENAREKEAICVNNPRTAVEDLSDVRSLAKSKPWDVRSDVFKNIEVGSAIIKDQLDNFDDADAKTVITSKSFRGLNVRKKDKRKIKHTLFKQKIAIIKEAKEAMKAKKKREQTVITGDMKGLEDSLPTVGPSVEQYLTSGLSQGCKTDPAADKKPTQRRRKRQQLQDIGLFQKVLQHPAYQKNPTGVIQEHLTNKMDLENGT